MLKAVYNTDSNRRNKKLINAIKLRLSELKDGIEKISKDEVEIEKPYKTLEIVEMIPHFYRQNQEWQGLKILTPD